MSRSTAVDLIVAGPKRVPDFLGVGSEKCGTTWLWTYFKHHDEVGVPAKKELRYFLPNDHSKFSALKELFGAKRNHPRQGAWLDALACEIRMALDDAHGYLRIFGAMDHKMVGEFTPSYCALPTKSIRAMKRMNSKLKLIFMLRDPAERAISGAKMKAVENGEILSDEMILKYATKPFQIRLSAYSEALQRFRSFFPDEQIFVGFFDEIATAPESLLTRLCEFLDVQVKIDAMPLEEIVNPGAKFDVSEDTLQKLRSLFQEEYKNLAEQFPDNVAVWMDKGPKRKGPIKRCYQPELIVCGEPHLLHRFNSVYRLHPDHAIAFASLNANAEGAGIKTHHIDDIEFDAGSTVICLEYREDWILSDEENFADKLRYFEGRGVQRKRILFPRHPGRIHRAIAACRRFDDAESRRIGHEAIFQNLFHRPNYAYGLMAASEIARHLESYLVTVAETGVWHGTGLRNMCEICDFLTQTRGVGFEVFGFDTGAGLPKVKDWRDHPELWPTGSMVMPDRELLRRSLPPNCELIIGDLADTAPRFANETLKPGRPLGFLALDVDLYTSAVSALRIFEADARKYLPVVPIWVDDANINIAQNSFAGEALAISEFNQSHSHRKIDQKIVRTNHEPHWWHHCFYFAHVFDHPTRNGDKPGALASIFHVSL